MFYVMTFSISLQTTMGSIANSKEIILQISPIYYLNIPVTQYVLNPIRCYICQRFGHVTCKCKHNVVCASCSESVLKDEPCTKAFKCVNCEENHASYNTKCCRIGMNMIVSTFKYQIMCFFEARKVYQQFHGEMVMNYAGVVKAPVQSTSIFIQSDMSWIELEPVPQR